MPRPNFYFWNFLHDCLSPWRREWCPWGPFVFKQRWIIMLEYKTCTEKNKKGSFSRRRDTYCTGRNDRVKGRARIRHRPSRPLPRRPYQWPWCSRKLASNCFAVLWVWSRHVCEHFKFICFQQNGVRWKDVLNNCLQNEGSTTWNSEEMAKLWVKNGSWNISPNLAKNCDPGIAIDLCTVSVRPMTMCQDPFFHHEGAFYKKVPVWNFAVTKWYVMYQGLQKNATFLRFTLRG